MSEIGRGIEDTDAPAEAQERARDAQARAVWRESRQQGAVVEAMVENGALTRRSTCPHCGLHFTVIL